MERRKTARAVQVVAAAAVVGAAVGVAVPAIAAEFTVQTAGWDWIEVHDTALGISDATAFHRDVLGSGVVLKGWTEDAFDAYDGVDGYLSNLGFTHQDPGLSSVLSPVPVSFVSHPGGGATVVSVVEDYDLGGGELLDVEVTLDIEGSFARWTIVVDDGGSGLVESIWGSGELGSPTTITTVGGNGLVVSGPSGLGPVIGFHVESDGVSDTVDDVDPEYPGFESFGAATIVYTLALLEYDPCAESAAIAQMTSLVPTLSASFGDDLAPVLAECVLVAPPVAMQAGASTDQLLELTLDGELAGGHPRLDGETYFDYLDLWTSGLAVLAPDLPAGLTLEVVEHPVTLQPALRLSGTPTEAFTGDLPLRFYGIRNSPDFAGELPVAATLGVDIAAADPPEGELAAAGVDSRVLVTTAAALLAAGGLALFVSRRLGAATPRG